MSLSSLCCVYLGAASMSSVQDVILNLSNPYLRSTTIKASVRHDLGIGDRELIYMWIGQCHSLGPWRAQGVIFIMVVFLHKSWLIIIAVKIICPSVAVTIKMSGHWWLLIAVMHYIKTVAIHPAMERLTGLTQNWRQHFLHSTKNKLQVLLEVYLDGKLLAKGFSGDSVHGPQYGGRIYTCTYWHRTGSCLGHYWL